MIELHINNMFVYVFVFYFKNECNSIQCKSISLTDVDIQDKI